MLYREKTAVFSEIHTKHINTLCGQNVEFVYVKPGGTYSNHWGFHCLCVQYDTQQVIVISHHYSSLASHPSLPAAHKNTQLSHPSWHKPVTFCVFPVSRLQMAGTKF
jgi:hypothetical protein